MTREELKKLISNLHITEIILWEMYKRYDWDRLNELLSPLYWNMKILIWEEMWDLITWWVYEVPKILEENVYVVRYIEGKEYKLITTNDFLDYIEKI